MMFLSYELAKLLILSHKVVCLLCMKILMSLCVDCGI